MTTAFLAEKQNLHLDVNLLPRHVAIIMDGNRRWAKNAQLPLEMGHWEGAEVLTEIVRAAAEWGVKTLTVYAFSTENWGRPQAEIDELMNLFELYLINKRELMIKEGIRLHAIGDLLRLPNRVQATLQQTMEATASSRRINLVLALNYGGRDEIKRAIGRILARHEKERITSEELTEAFIAQYLDTTPWGDPDLLIRTSGELRLSNFMLWQISYTEIYVTDVFWPEFTPKLLFEALLSYQNRQRRFGGSES
jgi:undecaprenyl diphosphate synthase